MTNLLNASHGATGYWIFYGESLEQVVDEISRYTTMSIHITDPSIRDIQIGGRFRVGEIDEMFNALETNFDLKFTQNSYNQVLISARQQQ